MNWWNRIYAKTPAYPEKSMTGCLLANALLVGILALFFWLAGTTLHNQGGSPPAPQTPPAQESGVEHPADM